MNMGEYKKVKDMTYLDYCDYLQRKYGISEYDYMTKAFSKNNKCTRTKEGLVVHHIDSDKGIMLSTKEYAMKYPFEWQTKEHLVYCDLLEHLLLHVLICIYPSPDKLPELDVGFGGAVNFMIPELNDLYSGWKTQQEWRKNVHERIINDKDVYLAIIEKFIVEVFKPQKRNPRCLLASRNDQFGLWDEKNNDDLYFEIFLLLRKHKLVKKR